MITVHFYAAARAAAGLAEMRIAVTSVQEVLKQCSSLNTVMNQLIPQCGVLVDGIACHDFETLLPAGTRIDILPKFAGG